MITLRSVVVLALLGAGRIAVPASSSAQTTRHVGVERDVRVEVVDWGGSGRALVLLAGLGGTAHDFDGFVARLTPEFHVYGITRRGSGTSSAPATGYTTDRLADDVLAVIDSLGLRRPLVAGHSFAGGELSSIGSRHPDAVAGLIYLDAGYPYAFYNAARGNYLIDVNEMRRRVEALSVARDPAEIRRLIEVLLATDLPAFERAIRERLSQLPPPSAAPRPLPSRPAGSATAPAIDSMMLGEQRFTQIGAPVLAIYALPHRPPPGLAGNAAAMAIWQAAQAEWPAQAEAFERGVPGARVVRIANADHAVFESNADDVVREIRAFVATLRPPR